MSERTDDTTAGTSRPLRRARWVAALLLLALLVSACGNPPAGGDPGAPGEPGEPPDPSSPPPTGEIALASVVDGLAFPAGIAHAGDDRLFVIELGGTVRIVQDGTLLATPFIDISDRIGEGSEGGLLGLAFPPDHATSGLFYLYYTNLDGDSVLSRFAVTADPNVADPASEEPLVLEEQPGTNHNGGQLAFGPDGFLYWALGDGGTGGAPAQELDTRLGKILRLDVSGSTGYVAPADNPFAGQGTPADEFWAYGLRNPWRFSFDRTTDELYIADVGESSFEEVNVEPADSGGGRNYGWPLMEAAECYSDPDCDAEMQGLTLPAFYYPWGEEWGRSITGGYVYRGTDVPELQGFYVFGDFITGRIWATNGSMDWEVRTLFETDYSITSFGEDAEGELYLVDAPGGALYRFVSE